MSCNNVTRSLELRINGAILSICGILMIAKNLFACFLVFHFERTARPGKTALPHHLYRRSSVYSKKRSYAKVPFAGE